MSDAADLRLQRLLGGPALAGLRQRLRRPYERAEPGEAVARFRVGRLSEAESEALASLLGRAPTRAASLRVDAGALDAALQAAGIAPTLRAALEMLDGPIENAAARRAEAALRWAAVAALPHHPLLRECLAKPAGLGLLKRLARGDGASAEALCVRADAVLARLPARGLTRAQLAAETVGDAHALDSGKALATLVLAALPREEAADDERIRARWAQQGVLVNELARPALALNLQVRGEILAAPGEPAYLSLRRLLRAPPSWNVQGCDVYVCENPNLVAIAADLLACRCRPLVCSEGMPAAAQRVLLIQLAQAGARLHVHADFDWPGLRIAAQVMAECGAQPWRFGAADYLAAANSAPGAALSGVPATAAWDGELAPAMHGHALAIAEEALWMTLLEDLRQ